jgi:hypothetical protein
MMKRSGCRYIQARWCVLLNSYGLLYFELQACGADRKEVKATLP